MQVLHTKTIEILWDDMDAYGHVNNAKYFTYMQECRFDWLKVNQVKYSATDKAPVLSGTRCKFIRPIIFPATITIDMYLISKNGKKIIFGHNIYDTTNPETIYALGEADVVWFDFINQRSIYEPEEYQCLYPKDITQE